MKNLTQLIQEFTSELRDATYLASESDPCCYDDDNENQIIRAHTSSLTAIIRSEIERKKILLTENTKPETDNDWFYGYGYNTAITEDIAYWQNVLEEIEKNV